MTKQSMGEFLATLRKDVGLTQQEVADKLNISDRTLSSWETGRTEPDLSSLTALAKLYGVTADEILSGERKDDAPQNTERNLCIEKFNERCKLFTALGILCALLVFAGFATLLYSAAPIWVSVFICVVGAGANAACIILTFISESAAVEKCDDKASILPLRHTAANTLIFNSLPYIAGAIIFFVLYIASESLPDAIEGMKYFTYESMTLIAVFSSAVCGGVLLLASAICNLLYINCLGNGEQKASAKHNVKLFYRLLGFGAIPVVLCLIPLIVLSYVTIEKTEKTYFTANGVEGVYREFQTVVYEENTLLKGWHYLEWTEDGGMLKEEPITATITKGEYYFDFQNAKSTEPLRLRNQDYAVVHEVKDYYSLGNDFYAEFYDNGGANVYHLKDGATVDQITEGDECTKWLVPCFYCGALNFTAPDGSEQTAYKAAYTYRNINAYINNYWIYGEEYNIIERLELIRNGDEYTYRLIGIYDYSPTALYATGLTAALSFVVCSAVFFFMRKRIKYEG